MRLVLFFLLFYCHLALNAQSIQELRREREAHKLIQEYQVSYSSRKSVKTSENKDSIGEIIEDPILGKIYCRVPTMPSFPGGNVALMNYLSQNVVYPGVAEVNGIQGRVIVQFIVGKDGNIFDVKIAKSVDPSLDREALRVVNAMPKWIPGKFLDDEEVNVRYTLPVTFRLK